MRTARVSLAVLLTGLLVAGPAQAGKVKTYAPPGKAGTSQYAEVVPTAGGNSQTPAMGGGNSSSAQIVKVGAGKAGITKIAKLGKQGAAAATFAEQTAPAVIRSAHALGSRARTSTGAAQQLTPASDGSALSGVGHLLSGSDAGGIGLFLPLLLAFGLGAAVTLALVRARRPRDARARQS